MKKHNAIQSTKRLKTLQRTLLFTLSLAWLIPILFFAFSGGIDQGLDLLGFSGPALASMTLIGNIDDVADRYTTGQAIAYKVWLIEANQINSSVAFPLPNGAREVATIPMLTGQYAHYFEAHDVPAFTSGGESGDITVDATNTFSIIMGGFRDQLLDFIEQKAGCKFIIIFSECESDVKYILGTPCKPMKLKSYASKHDKENRSVTFTFENKSLAQPKKYVGTIPAAEPVQLVAGATTLAVTSNSDYLVPNGAAATYAISGASGIGSSDYGRVITLHGQGTDNSATIPDGATFLMEDGATWTAKAGSRISFRILDSTTLTEVTGSRVQTV